MSTISKKKLKEIDHTSVYDEILRDFSYKFTDDPPDMWTDQERSLFDMVVETETTLKKKIIEIINRKNIKYENE